MNSPLPASGPAPRRNWTRRLVNLLVALVVIAVAAAAFVFSYDGVHSIALLGGVSSQLARYYPGLFDAVLVIACVAAVMLRDGHWLARLWAWVVIIVLLAAIGTTDVLHAMNYTLRHRVTEGVVAAAPVVAVLLAFSLLLTLLRQSRTHAQAPAGPAPHEVPALSAAVTAPIALPPAPVAASPSVSASAPTEAMPAWDVPSWEAQAAEVTGAEAPTRELPATPAPSGRTAPTVAEPAPPTVPVPVPVPALSHEPPTVPPRAPHAIRYAGNGVPGMAGNQPTAGRAPGLSDIGFGDTGPDEEYWDNEDAGQLAGLVYQGREDHAEPADGDADDPADGESAPHATSAELDDDAPPFAPGPRLNRVRSLPTPPADEEDEDE